MRTTIMRGSLGAMLILGVACGTSDPTSVPGPDPTSAPVIKPPAAEPIPSAPKFPEPTGPSRTFDFDHPLSYQVSSYTIGSRFILYDDGAFALQYPGGLEYRGGFTEIAAGIWFDWEGWSSAGPWGALGTFHGDTLTVQYNMVMSLSDFEDAVYVRR